MQFPRSYERPPRKLPSEPRESEPMRLSTKLMEPNFLSYVFKSPHPRYQLSELSQSISANTFLVVQLSREVSVSWNRQAELNREICWAWDWCHT